MPKKHKGKRTPRSEPKQTSFNPFLDEYRRLRNDVLFHYPLLGETSLGGWWHLLMSIRARAACYRYMLQVRKEYAWAIPDETALQELAVLAPIVEIGAGTGYWASLLRKMGVDIVAYDEAPISSQRNEYCLKNSWSAVLRGDASAVAKHDGHTLFMCYPPPPGASAMSSQALSYYKGSKLAYIGFLAKKDAGTGDWEFHCQLDREWILQKAFDLPSPYDFVRIKQDKPVLPGSPWLTTGRRDIREKLFIFQRKEK